MGLSIIQRYIFKQGFKALLVVMLAIMAAILLVDTVEQLRTVGTRANIGIEQAVYLSLLKLPQLVEHTLPFALLISTMLTYRQMSLRAELPVIRASGLSAWFFLTPTILLAVIIGFLTMMVISPFGSDLAKKFESERSRLLGQNGEDIAVSTSGIWMRDGDTFTQTIIHAEEIDETGTILSDVKMLQEERVLNPDGGAPIFSFSRRIDADIAKLEDGFWQLTGVIEHIPGETVTQFNTLSLPTGIERAVLIERFSSPSTIGFWDLPDYTERAELSGINGTRYRLRWLSLTALPALFVAMSLIGALACLRLARLGGTGPLIATAAAGAIGLYFVIQLSTSIGGNGAIPPLFAAWSPPSFAIFVCLALVAYHEDG